jgi:UPF0755 protein
MPEGMPSILVYERLMANDQLTGKVAVPAEGSILPDSYAYRQGRSARRGGCADAGRDEENARRAWAKRSPDTVVKTKPKAAVTLASIVEKETSKKSGERRTVAGVYSNRLQTGMRLQADPTIIYPITKGKPLGRRIRGPKSQAVNGYNTYSMVGLPKGADRQSLSARRSRRCLIPNGRRRSILRRGWQGGHVFADTLEEHNANVRKWFALRKERGI